MHAIHSEIDKQHVEERLHDWKTRVSDLYSLIEAWLRDSPYRMKEGSKLTMYEEMMYKVGIPKTYVDTVDIYKGKRPIACLKPRGLWIIGVNGSIDFLTINNNHVLVDVADQFCQPQWRMFIGHSGQSIEFTQHTLLEILDKVA